MLICNKCDKFLFISYKTNYGEVLCERCYYLRNNKINNIIKLIDKKGLFQLVKNLFDKYIR